MPKNILANLKTQLFPSYQFRYPHIIPIILCLILIILSLVTRVYSGFFYTTFLGDQVRDAIEINKIKSGELVGYGPGSSVGGYFLLPLYYYLILPFTLFSNNPVFYNLGNSILSFFTCFLVVYLVYSLTKKLTKYYRLVLGLLSGIWWAVMYNDQVINTMSWNPGPIPFFLIIYFGFIHKTLTRSLDKLSNYIQYILWFGFGLVVTVLLSLHSTTMFVIPLVTIVFFIEYFLKTKDIKKPLFAIFSAWISLVPYWLAEWQNHGQNTRRIIGLILQSDKESGFLTRINRSLFNLLELGDIFYFIDIQSRTITAFLMAGLIILGLLFNSKKIFWRYYFYFILIYSYTASSYTGTFFVHFKAVIWILPIILVAEILNQFTPRRVNFSKFSQITVYGFLLTFVAFSFISNLQASYIFLESKISNRKTLNTQHLAQALEFLPRNSVICLEKIYIPAFDYINLYLIKKSQKQTTNCGDATYAIMIKNRYEFPKIIKQSHTLSKEKQIFESDALQIYKIQKL